MLGILLLILGLAAYLYFKRQKDSPVNRNQQTTREAEPIKQETIQTVMPPKNETAQDAESLKQEQAPVEPIESVEQSSPIEKLEKETVTVTFSDGTTKEYNLNLTLNDTHICLLSDGGKTYHTHVNCFKNWPAEYQENFKGWKAITTDEAEKMGYRKCNYCNEADRTEWDYYKDSKPLKTFTVTHRDEFAITEIYNVGNEVNTGYDFEKDKDTLEIDYEEICYMPKSARDFFDENYGDYKMFVLDVYENDNGKVKIKIGIFKELGKNN